MKPFYFLFTTRVGAWVLVLLIAMLPVVGQTLMSAQNRAGEEGGELPDGIRVPDEGAGELERHAAFETLITPPARTPRAGRRSSKRATPSPAPDGTGSALYQYDPRKEIANLDLVLEMFDKRFGRPKRVIQYGCSGGGAVGLFVAEDFPNRVDGVIASAAHIPVWQMNTFLDGWFVLKALIAPELQIVNLPIEASGGQDHGTEGTLPESWRRAIDAAQRTPEGRARIALAFEIGQWPVWAGHRLTPQPKFDDVEALQHSMYHTAYHNAENPGGESRIRKEMAASGQQLSGNTGIDYREFFENGNESVKRAVRQLYQEAGLNLEADLAKVNAFPRVAASPYALEWWNQPGRTAKGMPRIPLLRMHEVGDQQVPLSLVEGYRDLIQANGKEDLYRLVVVNSPAHCSYSAAESMAAVETMMRRLDTGRWESTDPDQMNARAKALNNSPARFTMLDAYAQKKYNRTWAPATVPKTMQ